MTVFEIILLLVGGFLVGFINTLAGGGSIISLSLFMMMGLPANIANGTNRVAIFVQSLASAESFRRQNQLNVKKASLYAIPVLVGSLVGAFFAVNIDQKTMNYCIAGVMVWMGISLFYKPDNWIHGKKGAEIKKISITQIILLFFVGIYGGFIQVGTGLFLLAGLVLGVGYNLVKANAAKIFIILLYSPFVMIVFLLEGQINWTYGLILAAGTIPGGIIGSKIAVKKGSSFVRWVLISVIIFMVLQLTGIINVKEYFGY